MGEHVCSGCRQRPCVCETVVLPSAEKDVPVYPCCEHCADDDHPSPVRDRHLVACDESRCPGGQPRVLPPGGGMPDAASLTPEESARWAEALDGRPRVLPPVVHEQRDGVCVGCAEAGEPVEWLLAEARGHSDERDDPSVFPPGTGDTDG